MRTIIGAAIGVLVLGLLLIAFGTHGLARGANDYAALDRTALPYGAQARLVNQQGELVYAGNTMPAGPVAVSCAPGERALIRQTIVNGEQAVQVECAPDTRSAVYVDQFGRPLTTGDARVVPLAYPETRVVPQRRVVYSQERVTRPRRSWKKSALLIGGSTAAGAGVGGLVGGKKGALIGAALGGGASTIYEATKQR